MTIKTAERDPLTEQLEDLLGQAVTPTAVSAAAVLDLPKADEDGKTLVKVNAVRRDLNRRPIDRLMPGVVGDPAFCAIAMSIRIGYDCGGESVTVVGDWVTVRDHHYAIANAGFIGGFDSRKVGKQHLVMGSQDEAKVLLREHYQPN